jgi:penicillin-binding protein 1A
MGVPRRIAAAVAGLALLAGACAPEGAKIDEAALAPKVQSTKIFAADGSLITTLRQEENRDVIPISLIPKYVRDAVVAIEDSRFYTHKGVDAKAILRALYANASSGKVVEGGSTITQQLVRNSLQDVGRKQTLQRKLKEAAYAYQVDAELSKSKILELYLNTVYFGEGAYGIQTASQTYFNKNIEDLDLAEGAMLAGLIRSPVNYDPRINADLTLARRNRVLDRMFELGFAPAPDVATAKGTDLGVAPKADSDRYPAPYFVDYITRQIQNSDTFSALGESKADRANRLFRGGLRIYTTLDPAAQKAAEDAITKVLDHPNDPDATLVAVDPKTGYVKALVGGRDFFADQAGDPCAKVGAINPDGSPKTCAKVNLALGQDGGGSGRQAGSSFKPFVLATGLDRGMKLTDTFSASPCMDIPGANAGGPWHVCNYEDEAFGQLTVRDATVHSVNVVYAQMIMQIGAGRVVATAKNLGITSSLAAVPSAALGANPVSPLDMAFAYSAFPMLGMHSGQAAQGPARVAPISITKITDPSGKTLWKPEEKKVQALNPAVSYLVTKTLSEVIDRGTAARNGRIGRPAFGKTGTAEEWRDAWFVGGAGTDLVAAVSVFWPDYEIEMKPACGGERTAYALNSGAVVPPTCRATRIRVLGGSWPTQIWQLFMLKSLEGIPASTFPIPALDTVRVTIDISRGCLPNPYTPQNLIATQIFIKGTEPTQVCTDPAGPAQATVPNVVGFPQTQGTKILKDAGFVVTVKQEPSTLYPPGTVTRQSPIGGTDASPGATVTIWVAVSSQTAMNAVPDVVNMTEAQAKTALSNAGFKPVVSSGPCKHNDPRCIVKDQDPNAGTQAPSGSDVTIVMGLQT